MKSWLSFALSMLCVSVAFAEPPAPPATATQRAVAELVDKQLIAPMKKAESKRKVFSRAAPPARARRVRVETEALTDARGKAFVRFAVDVRHAFSEDNEWSENHLVGCAYPGEGEVFVRSGQAYVPARGMLGKEAKRRKDVCTPTTVASAQVARSS